MLKFDKPYPIAVDLDGTLITTDLGRYSLYKFCMHYPWKIPMVPFWLGRGRAYAKARLAKYVKVEADNLSYNQSVIRFIEDHKKKGHLVILATGAHEKYANIIAEHLGLFDNVLASNDIENTISHQKARRLIEMFGEHQFIYLGNSSQDLAVWQKAAHAIAVNTPASVLKKLSTLGRPYTVLE